MSQAAVVGGPEYTAAQYPAAYRGSIFLGDYATGDVRRALLDASGKLSSVVGFASGLAGPVDLEAGPTGNLVIVNFGTGAPGTGSVKEIRFTTGNTPPTAVATGTPANGAPPLAVSFSSAGSSDADGDPLGFQWDFGDGSPMSTAANPGHTYTTAGAYTATLTVSDGRGATATATVPITVGNVRPVPTIETPTAGSLYRDGDTISLPRLRDRSAGRDAAGVGAGLDHHPRPHRARASRERLPRRQHAGSSRSAPTTTPTRTTRSR